jgi:hypothetical protein
MKSAVIQWSLMIRVTPSLLHSAILDLTIKTHKPLFRFAFSLKHNFVQKMTFVFESKGGTCQQFLSGVAVSSGPAPDSALAPSFIGRSFGQLPCPHCTMPSPSRQVKIIHPYSSPRATSMAWRRHDSCKTRPLCQCLYRSG